MHDSHRVAAAEGMNLPCSINRNQSSETVALWRCPCRATHGEGYLLLELKETKAGVLQDAFADPSDKNRLYPSFLRRGCCVTASAMVAWKSNKTLQENERM